MHYRSDKQHVENIVLLRAIAAIGVCVCHIQQLTTSEDSISILAKVAGHGQLGVQMFFIISGFVLPLSLSKKNYRLNDFFSFLFRRSLRIDPPLWCCLLLFFLVKAYSSDLISTTNLLLNISYLVPFFKNSYWYLDVFWTLAIEFQFYVLLGLFFPLATFIQGTLTTVLLVIVFLYFLSFPYGNGRSFIFDNLPFFILGYLAFLTYSRKVPEVLGLVILSILCGVLTFGVALRYGVISLITLIILFSKPLKIKLVSLIGDISYSLYLTHLLVLIIISRFVPILYNFEEISSILVLSLCILMACIFHKHIERPSILLSKSSMFKKS